MSVTFGAFDDEANDWANLAPDLAVHMNNGNAERVGRAIGLEDFSDEYVSYGGSCTIAEMRERLLRWPDGHSDPYIHGRLAELVRLVLAVRNPGPGARITWG